MSLFQGFTLDTLLGCISCIIGIVAFFVGKKAFTKCKIIESSLNDKKEFNDYSSDYSQRTTGNIVNNYCDTNAITNLTSANFETSLNKAYSFFEQQSHKNLESIIEQTQKIIEERKPNIAGLTKIDWINIYFDCAKNTSDEYMQNIWAKLLALEVAMPGSFGYKTLDILKNMSASDFKSFEKLCSMQIDGWVFQEDIHSKYGLSYLELIKLSEHGLLNMGLSQNSFTIIPNEKHILTYDNLLILISNLTDKEIDISFTVYLLSSAAKELLASADYSFSEEYAKDCVRILSKQNDGIKVTLHKINYREGNNINYQLEDLCAI